MMAAENKSTLLQKCDEIVHFEASDSLLFKEISKYLVPNPRKIKRITNIYRAVRLISALSKRISSIANIKLLKWVILIEQWPVRMAWLIQALEDEEQKLQLNQKSNLRSRLLKDFYKDYVEMRIYNSYCRKDCPESLVNRYNKIYLLDSDPEIFEALLESSEIRIQDLGNSSSRSASKLLTYSIGLNPSIRNIISSIAAYRYDDENLREAIKPRYLLTVEKIDDVSEKSGYAKKSRNSMSNAYVKFSDQVSRSRSRSLSGSSELLSPLNENDIESVLGSEAESPSHAANGAAYVVDPQGFQEAAWTEATSGSSPRALSEDEGQPTDSVSFLHCALVFSALVRHGLTAPVIIGLYSAVGKSYFTELIFGSLKAIWLHEKIQLYMSIEDQQNSYQTSSEQAHETVEQKSDETTSSEATKLLNDRTTGYQSMDIESPPSTFPLENSNATEVDSHSSGSPRSRRIPTPPFPRQQTDRSRRHSITYDECDAMESKLVQFLEKHNGSVDDLYQWYLLDCPESALEKSRDKYKINKQKLKDLVETRNKDFSSTECVIELIYGIFSLVGRGFSFLFGSLKMVCCLFVRHTSQVKQSSSDGPATRDIYRYLRDARSTLAAVKEKRPKSLTYDYEFAKWDAWLFSGSDNLWAGLIKALSDSVENHYGPNFKYAREKATVYWILFLCAVCLALAIVSVYLLYNAHFNSDSQYDWPTILSILGTGATGVAAFVQSQMDSQSKGSNNFVNMVESEEFKSKLGFMAAIRDEIRKMGDLLSNPESVPTVWNYLLWWLGPFLPSAKEFCGRTFGGGLPLEHLNPCLLVIFVTDLDRCPPALAVDVLRSLVLLTEDSPIVVLLASDPRLLVSAIESEGESYFTDAGCSGFEFLDRIVTMPFAVPEMVETEKQAFCVSQVEMQKQRELLAVHNESLDSDPGKTTAVIKKPLPKKTSSRKLIIQLDCQSAGEAPVQLYLILDNYDGTTRKMKLGKEFKGRFAERIQLQYFDHFVREMKNAVAISFVVESREENIKLVINHLSIKCIVA